MTQYLQGAYSPSLSPRGSASSDLSKINIPGALRTGEPTSFYSLPSVIKKQRSYESQRQKQVERR